MDLQIRSKCDNRSSASKRPGVILSVLQNPFFAHHTMTAGKCGRITHWFLTAFNSSTGFMQHPYRQLRIGRF